MTVLAVGPMYSYHWYLWLRETASSIETFFHLKAFLRGWSTCGVDFLKSVLSASLPCLLSRLYRSQWSSYCHCVCGCNSDTGVHSGGSGGGGNFKKKVQEQKA